MFLSVCLSVCLYVSDPKLLYEFFQTSISVVSVVCNVDVKSVKKENKIVKNIKNKMLSYRRETALQGAL